MDTLLAEHSCCVCVTDIDVCTDAGSSDIWLLFLEFWIAFQLTVAQMTFPPLCVLASGIPVCPRDVHASFKPVMPFISQHSAIVAFSSADTLLVQHG